jgi:hypothetical protein
VGAVEEIHERERKLIRDLARRYLERLREKEGAEQIDPPEEIEWGKVVFRVRLRKAAVQVTLQIDP